MVKVGKTVTAEIKYTYWWRLPDSNWGHKALQASALPTELKRRLTVVELARFELAAYSMPLSRATNCAIAP